jgi:curli production assembly/transport component CsgF
MKKLLLFVVCSIVCGLFFVSADVANATELVWVPINPSFGGPSYNATWLMASAQAQNKLVEKTKPYTTSTIDPIEDFERRLNSQILYRLSNKIVDEAFGEEGLLPEGETQAQYTVGTFSVGITTDMAQITVRLTDITTGNTTTVEVPYF